MGKSEDAEAHTRWHRLGDIGVNKLTVLPRLIICALPSPVFRCCGIRSDMDGILACLAGCRYSKHPLFSAQDCWLGSSITRSTYISIHRPTDCLAVLTFANWESTNDGILPPKSSILRLPALHPVPSRWLFNNARCRRQRCVKSARPLQLLPTLLTLIWLCCGFTFRF